jgi:uncharacterized protein YdeI (YjbR/CyaY-like superfamily)
MGMQDAERIHPDTIEEWHNWLAEHHARPNGVWLVLWRRESGRAVLDYEETVLEALCFGWIDAITKVIDEQRRMMWFTPRSPRSGWARTNKARVEILEATGRMQPAGRVLIDAAKANGMWTVLDDAEAGIEHPVLTERLDAEPSSRRAWDALTPSSRKFHLTQIAMAKQDSTKLSRIDSIVAQLRS